MNEDNLTAFVLSEDASLQEAMARIETNSSRCVVLVTDAGKAVATLSEGDIIRALLRGADLHARCKPFAEPGFRFLSDRDFVQATELVARGITVIPVVDSEMHLTSVLTIPDVISHISGSK